MDFIFRALQAALDALLPPRRSERLVRATAPSIYGRLLSPAARHGAEGLLPYADPRVMALVWELKYYGSAHAATLGGRLIALHIEELLGEELVERPIVLAVPLHSTRQRERGYNQAERLAQRAAERLGAMASYAPGALVRVRGTPRQTELPRAKRVANVRGAFMVRDPSAIAGRACILIDDVLTTGSTLRECADTLRSAGASAVFPVALSYAE